MPENNTQLTTDNTIKMIGPNSLALKYNPQEDEGFQDIRGGFIN